MATSPSRLRLAFLLLLPSACSSRPNNRTRWSSNASVIAEEQLRLRTLLPLLLADRLRLPRPSRQDTTSWLSTLPLSPAPLVVQIGANDHAPGRIADVGRRGSEDPVPFAIGRGCRAILIEPVPQMAARLRQRYGGVERVAVVEAAVCAGCDEAGRTIFSVDMSNATGHWGSNTSDTRCAVISGVQWVQEVASFRAGHVLHAGRSITRMNARCQACAKALGRPLPPNCLAHVVSRNIRRDHVNCTCLRRELRGGARAALLMIDTEGFDYRVLQQYPFASVPAQRVIYESTHLSTPEVIAAAELMKSLGYANVNGGLGKVPTVTWHHMTMPAASP